MSIVDGIWISALENVSPGSSSQDDFTTVDIRHSRKNERGWGWKELSCIAVVGNI